MWNEQSVRWFRSASEHTRYNQKLAQLLLKYIPVGGSLCDIGCGAGLIDMELSPFFEEITCADISEAAIHAMEQIARERNIQNIKALCADAAGLKDRWDTVIALFFGGYDFLGKYYPLARERLILAVHSQPKGRFGPEGHKVPKCSDTAAVKTLLTAKASDTILKRCPWNTASPSPI